MIELTPVAGGMAAKLFQWRNNPEIMKWCRQSTTLDWNPHLRWMERLGSDPTIKMWVITANEVTVGVCGLTDISHIHQRAEFSLYVGPEHQGQGYGRAALAELIRQGFENLNLKTIWGETFDGNPAARLFESLGFVREGTRRNFYFKAGRHIDAHLYSITRDEWQQRSH